MIAEVAAAITRGHHNKEVVFSRLCIFNSKVSKQPFIVFLYDEHA